MTSMMFFSEHGPDKGVSEFIKAHTRIQDLEYEIDEIDEIVFDRPLELRVNDGTSTRYRPISSLKDFCELLPPQSVLVMGPYCYEHVYKDVWVNMKKPSSRPVHSYCLLADLCCYICNLDCEPDSFLAIVRD